MSNMKPETKTDYLELVTTKTKILMAVHPTKCLATYISCPANIFYSNAFTLLKALSSRLTELN